MQPVKKFLLVLSLTLISIPIVLLIVSQFMRPAGWCWVMGQPPTVLPSVLPQLDTQLANEGFTISASARHGQSSSFEGFQYARRDFMRIELATTQESLDPSGLSYALFDSSGVVLSSDRLRPVGNSSDPQKAEFEFADANVLAAAQVIIFRQ